MNLMCKKHIRLPPFQVIHYNMMLNKYSVRFWSINARDHDLIYFLSNYLVVFNILQIWL